MAKPSFAAIKKDYLEWLKKMVHADTKWSVMTGVLFTIDFYSGIEMDANRGEDGIALREEYMNGPGKNRMDTDEFIQKLGKCTVLEMMVALSKRCEEAIMYDPKKGNRTHIWFFKMLDNLHLLDDELDDESINLSGLDYIRHAVDEALMRKYIDNYSGGCGYSFWPLKDKTGIETMDIWTQMTRYLSENEVT